MPLTVEQLFQEAMNLPMEERLELAETLLAACDPPDGLPFPASWLAEIKRRSQQIDAGKTVLTPWAEVKQRVRERLAERSGG
jgi:putative addiction module component (TIGR02574 family)